MINEYLKYTNLGWKLVGLSASSKTPILNDWNQQHNMLTPEQAKYAGGLGLAHAYSGTMALDIDDWEVATEYLRKHSIDLSYLYSCPDAVTIESGNSGHGKLIYAMPFGIALRSKKLVQDKKNFLDFRCATVDGRTMQDVLPPSIHPLSKKPYRWSGKGSFDKLPVIPHELLSLWSDLIKTPDVPHQVPYWQQTSNDWQDTELALGFIPPDIDRDQWIMVGMAIHSLAHKSQRLDDGLALWDRWSAQSKTKYKGIRDVIANWTSFKANNDGINLGSLYHLARKYGWTKPLPDAQLLFDAIEPEQPKAVLSAVFVPEAPNVDLSQWPKVLTDRASEISEAMGLDPLVPLIAGLAAVCGAVDARTRLRLMNEYEVPPVLWLMTIGEPADKKSPGSKPMFKILEEFERNDIERFQLDMMLWEGKEAAWSNAKKDFNLSCINSDLMPNDVPKLYEPLPPQPVPVRVVVSDITSQKLVRQAADRPRGLLCVLDEMAGWVKKMTDRNSGDDRSAWVQSYEASSYKFDRVTAGTIDAEHFAIAIYGNIQPKVFQENLPSLSSDGLIQRFIPVVLRPSFNKRGNEIPTFLSNRPEYEAMIRKVYALPAQTYTLTQGAFDAFREFQLWYESVKKDERLLRSSTTFMTAFGKLEGTTGRLALLFHLIENSQSQQVTVETMNKAIVVVKRFIVPSFRYVYNVVGGNVENSLDQWIIEYVIQHSNEIESVTLSDIKRSAKRQLVGVPSYQADQEIKIIMDELQAKGWVSLLEETRRSIVWAINPNLAKLFADYRTSVIEAKKRRAQEMADRFTLHAGYEVPRIKVIGA